MKVDIETLEDLPRWVKIKRKPKRKPKDENPCPKPR